EFFVLGGVNALEIVPSGQVSFDLGGVEPAKLVFANANGADRQLVRRNAGARQFVVEIDVAVPIDRAEDQIAVAGFQLLLDVLDVSGVIPVAQGGVLFGYRFEALGFQVLVDNQIGGPWDNVVGTETIELLSWAAL